MGEEASGIGDLLFMFLCVEDVGRMKRQINEVDKIQSFLIVVYKKVRQSPNMENDRGCLLERK